MPKITSEAMRSFRKSKGWTQKRMADYMGVSVYTIQGWEQDSKPHRIPKRLLSDPRTKHLAR